MEPIKTLDDMVHTHQYLLVEAIDNKSRIMKCDICGVEALFVFDSWMDE